LDRKQSPDTNWRTGTGWLIKSSLSTLGTHGGDRSATIPDLPPSAEFWPLPTFCLCDIQQAIHEITTEALGLLFAMVDPTISDVFKFKKKFEFNGHCQRLFPVPNCNSVKNRSAITMMFSLVKTVSMRQT
jgi:hypothetical protein